MRFNVSLVMPIPLSSILIKIFFALETVDIETLGGTFSFEYFTALSSKLLMRLEKQVSE